jgi:hypothetical protein
MSETNLFVTCTCGKEYSLHANTLCPYCFQWPSASVQADPPYGLKCRNCGGVGCLKCGATGFEGRP